MAYRQGRVILSILIFVGLAVTYIIYKVSKGAFFKELHEPRIVSRPKPISESNERTALAFFVSILLSIWITNNVLVDITYFKQLFKESETWALIAMIGTFILLMSAFGIVFFLIGKYQKKNSS